MKFEDVKIGDRIKSDDKFRKNFYNPDRVWTVVDISTDKQHIYVKGDKSNDGIEANSWVIRENFEHWQIIGSKIVDLI